ncbi:MAG: hypothetical protein KF694_00785 [Mesorhizobium sp.]|nr:hypothetical protein [Mesorhizobium sp.]
MTTSSSDQLPDMSRAPDSVSGRDRAAPDVSPRDALDYMRTILSELSAIARKQRLDMLAYLVEMAYVEATDLLAREDAPGRGKRTRRRSGDAMSDERAAVSDSEQ